MLTTGIVATTFEVNSLSSLTTTSYGRLVLAKLLVFAVVVTAGVCHWHRRRTRLDTPRVRRPLRIEALAAGTAVALGAVLSAAPPPVAAAFSSAANVVTTASVSGLDARDAVSVAGPSGPFVVGLTLAPPRPGLVQARVQILSSTDTDRVRTVRITGSSPGGRPFAVTLRRDRVDTFGGSVPIDRRGLWTVGVSLTTAHHDARVGFTLPIPTPNGNHLLGRAVAAEEQLTSAQLHESVRATRPARR